MATDAPEPAKINIEIATQGSTIGDSTINTGDVIAGGKTVQGDAVHGDKVMGDKVNIGNINNSTGVAIGPGAIVNVIQEVPKSRIPLQRPPRATHFQDRKEDLAQLLVDLQPGRIMTLCGPGGIGKSALAAEVVWQMAPDTAPPACFPDGILFHSFYNQPQAAVALEHIARSFGEEPKPTPKEAAQRALGGRCALLILDGTEQADDLRQVVEIRDQCGILVTSRTRKDEIDKRKDVAPLPLDDAVTLLQAWGGVRASDSTTSRRIAEFVGRLPLALRLVGRYLAQNEENANDYLTWLTATPLTALDQGQRREQSVPLLLARSLEQVSGRARQALGVIGLLDLAPFVHDPVGVALEFSPTETRQVLGELVNYGLLLRSAESYEVSHTLIHTYACERLAPLTEMIVKLGTYYKQAIQQSQSDFSRLNTLRPHVMALVRIASERELWNTVSDLVLSIHNYLSLQGYWSDRIIMIESALTAAQATQDRQNEVIWLGCLGTAYSSLGQVEQAIGYYQQALALAKEIDDRSSEGAALTGLSSIYYYLGQAEQAVGYVQQAIAIAKETGDRGNECNTLNTLGLVYASLGQVEQAIGYHQQALVLAKEIGDRSSEGEALTSLGAAHRNIRQVKQSIKYHKQAIAIFKEISDRKGEANALGDLGFAFAALGQMKRAIGYFQQALTIAKETSSKKDVGTWLGSLGAAYADLGQAEQAICYYEQAIVIFKEIGHRWSEGTWLANLGNACRTLEQVEKAKQHWQESLRIFEEIKSPKANTVRQWLASLQSR